MTDRIPLAAHTKTTLDALYDELEALRQVSRGYCPACGRGDAAPTVDDWQRERQRADSAEEIGRRLLTQRQEMAEERYIWQQRGDRAEAALARIRQLADECDAHGDSSGHPLTVTRIRDTLTALDQPAKETP